MQKISYYDVAKAFAVINCAIFTTQPVSAHSVKNVTIAVLECRTLKESDERLACFDKNTEEMEAQIRRGELFVTSKQQSKVDERAAFGLAAAQKPPKATTVTLPPAEKPAMATQSAETTPPPAAPAEQSLDSITSPITEAIQTASGYYILVLEDASIWRTTEMSRNFMPRVGDALTIEKAAMGSFMGKTEKSRPVRIKRMR